MLEAVVVAEPKEVVSSNRKKKSEEDKLAVTEKQLVPAVPAPPHVVGNRGRTQAATRRVTPTDVSLSDTTIASGTADSVVEKQLPNGDLYIGSFLGNVPHGSGKYLWTDGCMYEGEWRRGKASGKGRFSWPSGATFEGEFKSGRMEGFGTFIGSDGDTYRGSWSSDRKHGYGQTRYANGDFYEGNWKRNLQEGQGRYVWTNGNAYIGEWKNGVISGRGVLIWSNGNSYDGHWDSGVLKGEGVFSWPDGSSYVGTWNKGVKVQQLTTRKRSSVDGARGSSTERNFPRICIWESDGEAGDITCDIIDNAEASMIYRESSGLDRDEIRHFRRSPCCFSGEVKKPGETISKGHKNYELMLNLQLGIR